MKKASTGKRFLAWLIDTIIIGVALFLIGLLLPKHTTTQPIEEVDRSSYMELYSYYSDHKNDLFGWEYSLKFDMPIDEDKYDASKVKEEYSKYIQTPEYVSYVAETNKNSLIDRGIDVLVTFTIFILYFDVLGYYWSKQTLGRFAMRIKVVDEENSKPSFGELFLRDFIGYEIFGSLCCGIPIIVSGIMILSADHLSIGDRISHTKMVDSNSSAEDDFNYDDENTFHHNSDDSISKNIHDKDDYNKEVKDAEIVDSKTEDKNSSATEKKNDRDLW